MILTEKDIQYFLGFELYKIKHKMTLSYGVMADIEYFGHNDFGDSDKDILILVKVKDIDKSEEWIHSLPYKKVDIVKWFREEKIKSLNND